MERRNVLLLLAPAVVLLAVLAACPNPASGGPEAEEKVSVRFDSQGGTAVEDQKVVPGTKLTEPTDLANGDLVFSGWYLEADCLNRWDFENGTVTEDLTLYARWNGADTLTFTLADGGTGYLVAKGAVDPEADLYIPASYKGIPVVGIGSFGFEQCPTLTRITIPGSVTTIQEYAFYSCASLQEIAFSPNVTSIPVNAFFYCSSLTGIHVDPQNGHYASVDGVLFNKSMSALLIYPKAKPGASYSVPAGVATVGDFAFMDSDCLTEVSLPASVTTIEYCAFQGCKALAGIFIPLTVTTVEPFAFIGCYSAAIRCQASAKPEGWHADWNFDSGSVTWGCSS